MATNNKPRGLPFAHGNPGRPPGSKNKATLLAASLSHKQGEALVQKAYEMAMDGNVAMLKFLLSRMLPKERPVGIELPVLDYASEGVDALAAIVAAVSSGQISPQEAANLAQLVAAFIKAIETTDVEMEIEALKTKLDEYCAEYKMDGIDQKDSA